MDITLTITAWDSATTSTARRAAGTVRSRVNPPAGSGLFATDPPRARATARGSGRSPTKYTAAPRHCAHRAITNPPVNGGSPSARPIASPGPKRLGPTTAPTVVDHTTRERSRARVRGAAASVAAKRDCRFRAVPAPSSPMPTSSAGSTCKVAATTMTAAPRTATRAPVVSDTRRPRRCASRASGMANSAAPRVFMVDAMPDRALLPETSVISSAPRASVAPVPSPPRICPSASTVSTRRWNPGPGSCRSALAARVVALMTASSRTTPPRATVPPAPGPPCRPHRAQRGSGRSVREPGRRVGARAVGWCVCGGLVRVRGRPALLPGADGRTGPGTRCAGAAERRRRCAAPSLPA